MICLGIESTAHTFSCAIIEKRGKNGKILSDIRKIYRPPEGEGIHPREASRHHAENSPQVLSECLNKADVKITDLDMVSYAAGPGLGPCLRIGAVVARSLSSYYGIPVYPVNHALGHIELGKMLTGAKDPLVLLVSGGHTMILAFLGKKWRVFGETLDITLGQLLDQIGRHAGFASPCGSKIEELASKSSSYEYLPYVVKGNDVSFSGLLSATKRIIPKGLEAACFSLQETAFSMIGEAVERALSFTGKKEFLVVGGVAANKRLSEIFQSICKRHNCKFFVSPKEYSGDCGSQISWVGLLESSKKAGAKLENTFVRQSWRLDTVEILY
ncbi:MAG: tRNA (adenosine(37)-N6)-threonylcarbamoyltransferase complex transferase subunit TsaD [Thaumarchaeota archaeon]|nr:tRNA (adenosine(37)-N6)-threonylcarbamoyltransferase complex transferase subunit TsaD [Nitrososphaerota archaeon]MDE1867464.1 tRNA (adenosine(37)-N6)-threonylcarbamoyltransferase complex transferase subunit TsaD [Nitrososphaerota archaeon]